MDGTEATSVADMTPNWSMAELRLECNSEIGDPFHFAKFLLNRCPDLCRIVGYSRTQDLSGDDPFGGVIEMIRYLRSEGQYADVVDDDHARDYNIMPLHLFETTEQEDVASSGIMPLHLFPE
jgi:hypothetical protein